MKSCGEGSQSAVFFCKSYHFVHPLNSLTVIVLKFWHKEESGCGGKKQWKITMWQCCWHSSMIHFNLTTHQNNPNVDRIFCWHVDVLIVNSDSEDVLLCTLSTHNLFRLPWSKWCTNWCWYLSFGVGEVLLLWECIITVMLIFIGIGESFVNINEAVCRWDGDYTK